MGNPAMRRGWTPWAVRPIFASAGPYFFELSQVPEGLIGQPGAGLRARCKPQLALRLVHLAAPEQEQPEVEAHRRRPRKPVRQRPEPRERGLRPLLREAADGGRDERLRLVPVPPRGLRVDAPRRDRPAQPLQRDAVVQPPVEPFAPDERQRPLPE